MTPPRFYIKNKKRYEKIDPIGLVVQYEIEGDQGHGVVIGTMIYDEDVWCIATEKIQGMPINKLWCTFSDTARNPIFAQQLRKRHIDLFGERFNGL
jgi:hypothetical protein